MLKSMKRYSLLAQVGIIASFMGAGRAGLGTAGRHGGVLLVESAIPITAIRLEGYYSNDALEVKANR